MAFEKEKYAAYHQDVIELIKQSHDWENSEGFIADGVINSDTYSQQKLRVLCVLAESYGYDKNGVTDIQSQCAENDLLGLGSPAVKSVRRLTSLLWALLSSLEHGQEIEETALHGLYRCNPNNLDRLQQTLARLAWINVKKASRADGTRMDALEVFRHATERNGSILAKQIDATSPHLIIICGEQPFRALHSLNLLGENVHLGKKLQLQGGENGPLVVELSHPAARTWNSYKKLHTILSTLFQSIQTSKSSLS
ncbi:hypothetical protein [Verrucomicrobium spinosum]|uniref:hypothetical protein n=1 Tax=Verrucomicrobium spinosum TaxID=2736 RepID=UPI000174470A|nr:hypothetical protein [Verrucomicrobium spinosum]